MRVLCRHGHFAFYPRNASEIAKFSNYFNVTLKRENDYFTFSSLFGAKNYSILGKPYLNLPAVKTFEGLPWYVMKANGFVYDISLGVLIPKLSVISVIELPLVGFYFRAGGSLIQPGSRTLTGQQILSYSGEFVDQGLSLNVVEFDYE